MSRKQLYSVITRLKRENDCLKTDLTKFKVLSNGYKQYFDESVVVVKNQIKSFKKLFDLKTEIQRNEDDLQQFRDSCFVSLEKLSQMKTQITENSHHLSGGEDSQSDNDSVVIECVINYKNQ